MSDAGLAAITAATFFGASAARAIAAAAPTLEPYAITLAKSKAFKIAKSRYTKWE